METFVETRGTFVTRMYIESLRELTLLILGPAAVGGCGVGSVLLFRFQEITRRRLKSSSTKRNNRLASRTQPKVVKSKSLIHCTVFEAMLFTKFQ